MLSWASVKGSHQGSSLEKINWSQLLAAASCGLRCTRPTLKGILLRLTRSAWVSHGFLSPPGRADTEHSHPAARSSHPEGHWPLPDVLPHGRPHSEGNTRPELGKAHAVPWL